MEADAQPLPRNQQSQRKRCKKACDKCRKRRVRCNHNRGSSRCVEAGGYRITAQPSAPHLVDETDRSNRPPVNFPSNFLVSVASTPAEHESSACNSSSGFSVESRFPIEQHSVSYGPQPPPPAIVYDGTTSATAVGMWYDPTTAYNILLNCTMPDSLEPWTGRYSPIVSRSWYWRLQADVSQQTGVQVSEAPLPNYSDFLNISKALF